ncbi:MAG TPA: 1-deoxy-D-xylulose-5-phosphate synthase, partial [Gammaproteobacteria bacterium]|nr:1-deoxy-D-xylulose-5-phosphate synthase [Gammaproteobacteria bacterium]
MDKPTPLTPLLDQTSSPQLLRQLNSSELPELAQQLRDFMIHSVEKTGGHLASSLGVVELSIALHYIYNTPEDRLVWDVGHQCYPHKILTGRKEAMTTLRQQGGISGFTKRGESPYDPFGAGHSSTSISAALGMAIASKQASNNRQTVAVIGDGALTGGMAFEALNHAGESNADLLVVLNDNDMSISENVGGLSRYLGRILTSSTYSQ